MKKLAIQLSGQLRNWPRLKKIVLPYWKRIIEVGEENGVEIHLHGTFWNEAHALGEQHHHWGQISYSRSNSDWEDFKFISFLKEPFVMHGNEPVSIHKSYEAIFQDDKPIEKRKQNDMYKGDMAPIASWPWGFCMYEASKNRRFWQREHNYQYDLVLVTRPEIYLERKNVDEICNRIEELSSYDFTVFSHAIQHDMTDDEDTNSKGFDTLPFSDDTIILGTEESINLYCTSIVSLFLDNNLKLWRDFSGHIAVPYIIKNLTLNPLPPHFTGRSMLSFNLFRMNSDVAIVNPELEHKSKNLEVSEEWNLNLSEVEDFHLW